jgi:hypothetical protein
VIDDVVFAASRELHVSDQGKDGDDLLLAVSFLAFKSDLRTFGVTLDPVCDGAC